MLAKRHQLRAELRGHLVQVLEERGISASIGYGVNTASPLSSVSQQEKKREYARALQLQIEESRRRKREEEDRLRELYANRLEEDDVSAWYHRERDYAGTSASLAKRKLTPEEQREALFEQMEEVRRRREEEQRKREEEDARWEEYALRSAYRELNSRLSAPTAAPLSNSDDDWQGLLQHTRHHIENLERDMLSITRQLTALKTEEERIVKHLSPVREEQNLTRRVESSLQQEEKILNEGSSADLSQPQARSVLSSSSIVTNGSTSSKRVPAPQAEDEVVVVQEAMPRLNVTARYFVYVSRTKPLADGNQAQTPELPSMTNSKELHAQDSKIQRRPERALELKLEDELDLNESSDSDDDFEEDEGLKRAALYTLERTDASSPEDDFSPANRGNKFGDKDMFDLRSTPMSKLSAPSFDL